MSKANGQSSGKAVILSKHARLTKPKDGSARGMVPGELVFSLLPPRERCAVKELYCGSSSLQMHG